MLSRLAKQTEHEIQAAILQYLASRRILAWRVNTGAARYPGKDGRARLVRFSPKGQPDIAGVLPGGRALFVEVKRPGCIVTRIQQARLVQLSAAGALAFVAQSVEEVACHVNQAQPSQAQ